MALVYILIGIIVLPIVLLTIPLDIEYTYDSQAKLTSQIRISWLFGLVRIKSNSSIKEQKSAARMASLRVKETSKLRKPAMPKRKSGKILLAVMTSEGLLRRVFRLLYEVLTVAKIKQLQASVKFGLDDPADTGRLYGSLAPAFSILYAIPQVNFVAMPLFDRIGIDANMRTCIRVVPIHYIKAVLLFVFTKEFLRAVRAVIKVRYS